MLFNSALYLLFLPVVFFIYYYTKAKYRWIVLLFASFLFYASLGSLYLLLVLLLTILITYFFGLQIYLSKTNKKKLFYINVTLNVLILICLKYLPFLTTNLNIISKLIHIPMQFPIPEVLISVGVSFYILQTISYLNDIYLEKIVPEKHFGYFAVYLSFFPKLLQGPIERASSLLPQLKKPYKFDYNNTKNGLLLFTWGLFKKVVIADRLAVIVNTVYRSPSSSNGLSLIIATYAFAFQIYADFSGYTDMARGSAKIFAINLSINFRNPYFSRSIQEFWQSWHITFSSWLQDYIFKPLQMQFRRMENWSNALSLLITFLISGLWHGANWTFIIWGALHGLYLAVYSLIHPTLNKAVKRYHLEKNRLLKALNVFITFNLVCFAWIFFRANSLYDAKYILTKIANTHFQRITIPFDLYSLVIIFSLILLLIVEITPHISNKSIIDLLNTEPILTRWAVYIIFILFIISFGKFKQNEFIYFAF
jgi:alginate O-acetyltransferase complex protein AlgI